MTDIDRRPIAARFPDPEQERIRVTRLNEWWLERVLEDRADSAVPPLELLPAAGHG
jgi:hypothetical protein